MKNHCTVSWVPLLGVLFIALKLTGYIAWPWLWVLAPFWIGIVLALGFLAVILLIALIVAFNK